MVMYVFDLIMIVTMTIIIAAAISYIGYHFSDIYIEDCTVYYTALLLGSYIMAAYYVQHCKF